MSGGAARRTTLSRIIWRQVSQPGNEQDNAEVSWELSTARTNSPCQQDIVRRLFTIVRRVNTIARRVNSWRLYFRARRATERLDMRQWSAIRAEALTCRPQGQTYLYRVRRTRPGNGGYDALGVVTHIRP